jgi:hypothetical protein
VEIIAIRLRESFRQFLDGDEAGSQDTKPRQKSQRENRGYPSLREGRCQVGAHDTSNRQMTGGRLIAPDKDENGASTTGSVEITSG